MDADAYLKRHGWKGTGHALDNHGRGIKKPLLIAHKQDQLGLGQKKAAHRTDDQWWMRAFDESLKNIGTGQEVCSYLTKYWDSCYTFARILIICVEHPQSSSQARR
jgi:hypothetical protein